METGRKTSKKPNDMQSFHYIIRTLLHSKGSNLLKVVSLGLGLAISILLFSRVAFEQSYDTCFKGYDRLYQVWSQFTVNAEKYDWQQQNSGPVVGAICESFPELVESGTCTCRWMAFDPLYYGNTRFDEPKICADSLFFQTMGIEVLSGNPVQDLQQPNVIYLCETLARRMFGGEDPIGKVISYNYQRDLTVRGTYADIPDNTTVKADAIISLPPSWAAQVTNYSWDGGDSYHQYVRLKPGVDAEAVNSRLEAMMDKYRPAEIKEVLGYAAKIAPLRDTYRSYDTVRRMKVIMLVIGFSILFLAALNYALISISSLSRRAKAVGVQKCSGASGAGIFGMFLAETAIIILLSLCVMVFLLFAFQDFVEETAGTRLHNLFAWSRLWVPALTVLLLFVVGGVIPGHLFARIPVTQVFRCYTEGKKGWKRPLLFVQFAGVAFICGLMAMGTLQYNYVMNKDMGFRTEGIATGWISFQNESEWEGAENFFRGLPYVEDVTSGGNPIEGYSGTMIEGDGGQSLFSSRFDQPTENYHAFMGMTYLAGRAPRWNTNWWDEVAVNETFADFMHWPKDDVVGRTVRSMGKTSKVVGLLKDFQIQGFYSNPTPYIAYAKKYLNGRLYFKLKEPFGDNLLKLQQAAAEAYPGRTIDIYSYQGEVEGLNYQLRVMRNAVIVSAIVMFFIMLMGLLGYTADEVQRRSKEIAIRKVNGAEAGGILELLGRDILWVALPAVLIGVGASAYVNGLWLDMFSVTVPGGWAVYVLVALVNLLVILACVLWRTWHIANENPVLSLKNE